MSELSREGLYTAYIGEQRSIRSLANELGCSYWKVRTALQKWGIKMRTPYGARALKTKKIEWVVDERGCWICISHYRIRGGYHQIVREGKTYTLHRYLYMAHYDLSETDMRGLVVMHTCDNPSCINIDHLRLGTQSDNMKDRIAKGR